VIQGRPARGRAGQGNAKATRSYQMRRAISRRHGGQAILICCVVLFGFGLGISEAHSRLVKSDPSARAVLDTAPKELKLWFNEAIKPAPSKVWIVPVSGPKIPVTSHGDSSDPRLLIVALPDNLAAGPVLIGYHVLSVDGHVVDNKLTFTIKKPD
jgi:methionine-rich copper-binding protein CopC